MANYTFMKFVIISLFWKLLEGLQLQVICMFCGLAIILDTCHILSNSVNHSTDFSLM